MISILESHRESVKSGSDKEEMYGKIAQKLIEMADAYQGTGPAETVGAQAG